MGVDKCRRCHGEPWSCKCPPEPIDPRDAEIAALREDVRNLKAAKEGISAVGYREGVLEERARRDAEIAGLRADLARHKRALAAGPAALRRGWLSLGSETAAGVVERAQAEAMKEKP